MTTRIETLRALQARIRESEGADRARPEVCAQPLATDCHTFLRLVDRLRGRYASGPHLPNGKPEFGWRQFEAPPIQHEAASEIERLQSELSNARRKGIEECAAIAASFHFPYTPADTPYGKGFFEGQNSTVTEIEKALRALLTEEGKS